MKRDYDERSDDSTVIPVSIRGPLKPHKPGAEKAYPLHEAVLANDILSVKYYIENGTDINAKNEGSWTPVELAGFCGLNEIIQLLIQAGALVRKSQAKLFILRGVEVPEAQIID